MKKIIMSLLLAIITLSAQAQFERGTSYISTSLTGLDLSYQKDHFSLGLGTKAGYFFEDAWMAYGQLGYSYQNIKGGTKGFHNDTNSIDLGAGLRYYILQNGIYLNLGVKFEHTFAGQAFNNFCLTPEVGYCFYLNHYLSIEPAVYYDLSVNHFSDASKVGLKLGFGYYF